MKQTIYIMSSLHRWNDDRTYYREALSLKKYYKVVICGVGNFYFKKIGNVEIYGVPERKKIYKRILSWFKLLKLALKIPASIYHFHDPELILISIIIKILKKDSKIIYDIHEKILDTIQEKIWISKPLRRIMFYLWPILETYSIKRYIDYIVTASDDIAMEYQKYKNKVVIIRNYAHSDFFKYNDSKIIEKKHNLYNNSLIVIYAGSLMRAKGILEIVKAIKYVDRKYDIKLILTNNFNNTDFEKKVKKCANNQVIFTGRLPYKEVFEYLKMSDIGLVCYYPISNYLNGIDRMLKIFEYMSVGLPIIISNFPTWNNFIAKNQCGITVDPMSPKSIAKAIEWFISHPEEMVKMGENGKKAIKEKYNWDMESQKLVNVYRKLLK